MNIRKLPPGLGHALIGICITMLLGSFIYVFNSPPFILGAGFALMFYFSRERRQSEEFFGSNRVSLLKWKPRAWRDMFWPFGAGIVVAMLLTYL